MLAHSEEPLKKTSQEQTKDTEESKKTGLDLVLQFLGATAKASRKRQAGRTDCWEKSRADDRSTEAGSLLGQDRRQGMASRWEFRTPWAVSRSHPL